MAACTLIMCPHPSLLRVAIAAIAVCFSICGRAAPAEHASSGTDIEEALARVNAVRVSADDDPLALEEALTALGDAYLSTDQYASAAAAYAEAVQSAEQHGGRETRRLLAPLTGLGTTLARTGRHQDAIPRLQRAVAITRAQSGMFDLSQQDVLQTLAYSLTAVDRQSEAQDLMLYRVRVAEKAYGEGNAKVIPLLCDLGDWFADIGKTPEARMTFQVALNIAQTTDSLNAPIVVAPLRGIARAYMLRSSYPDSWRQAPRPESGCDSRMNHVLPPECLARLDATGKLRVDTRTLNKEGEQALQRALQILESDPGSAAQARIETQIQMGDWYQIRKSPHEALTWYQRAWKLIRATPGLPDFVAASLNTPVRVYYPTPQIVVPVTTNAAGTDRRSNYVQAEFTVAADGTVHDARIVDHDTLDRYARDILKAIGESRFRPKFIDGQAVAARGITYREVFWTSTPSE